MLVLFVKIGLSTEEKKDGFWEFYVYQCSDVFFLLQVS